MPGKFSKIHKMIEMLENTDEGLSYIQISKSLYVDVRTAKRYLAEIRQAGYHVYDLREASNQKSLFKIHSSFNPPEHFVPTLKKVKNELSSWGNPKFAKFINQIILYFNNMEQADQNLCSASGEYFSIEPNVYHIDHGPFSQENVAGGILKKMEAAILNHNKLRITYWGYKAEKEEFDFFPYYLSLRVGTLYLIGRRGKNTGAFKSLSVKRIRRCVTTSSSFVPARFQIEEYYKYCFGQFPRQVNEKPSQVVLKVNEKWLQKFLEESHFNPPGKIVRRGGHVFFELQVMIKPDFINWVLSLVPHMLPVRPRALVKAVEERIAGASERLKG
jgi:predicted DNA-binding transcriptional regulator YafY